MAVRKTEIGEDPHGYKALIARKLNEACAQKGGLPMHINERGGKKVNENHIFRPGDLWRVDLSADFTPILTFKGARCLVQDRAQSLALFQSLIRDNFGHEGSLGFKPGVSFRVASEETTEAVPAK